MSKLAALLLSFLMSATSCSVPGSTAGIDVAGGAAPLPTESPVATETTAEAVDLGLSVKWASFNVGAEKPEDYGTYFGWGDVTGKNTSQNNNVYPNASPPANISGTEYDAARILWGGSWQMPTKEQADELVSECDWKTEKLNGVDGFRVTGKNGNSIFLAAGGGRDGTTVKYTVTGADFWTGTRSETEGEAWCFTFYQGRYFVDDLWRHYGFAIRPVQVEKEDTSQASNILVAYFSQSGNTQKVALEIGKQTGGDVFRIETAVPYSDDMAELVKRKNAELAAGQMPELAAGVENINFYDVVFIGYPIWAMTAPPPVRSFIQSNDLTGKIIVPFCTHDGYGFGNSVDVIRDLLPRGTTVTEGFDVKGSEAGGASRAIASWLEKISGQWNDTK